MCQNMNIEWLNMVYLRAQYWVHSSSSFILITLILNHKSPVLLAFLLMIVPFTDQYILKVASLLYKKIYSSGSSRQIHGKWHLISTNVSFSVSLIICQV